MNAAELAAELGNLVNEGVLSLATRNKLLIKSDDAAIPAAIASGDVDYIATAANISPAEAEALLSRLAAKGGSKADDLSSIIKKAENISTAKPNQATAPRDLNEQTLWNMVQREPQSGRALDGLNSDPRFPQSAGFQKMEAKHKLPDGSSISIHYQYNSNTGKAYDMKITSPQRVPPVLQPGKTIKD